MDFTSLPTGMAPIYLNCRFLALLFFSSSDKITKPIFTWASQSRCLHLIYDPKRCQAQGEMVENKPPVNRYTCQQRRPGGYCPEQSWRWPFCEFSFPFITVQLGSDFAIPMNSIELSVNSPQQMHHNEEQVNATDFVLTSGYIQPLFRGKKP